MMKISKPHSCSAASCFGFTYVDIDVILMRVAVVILLNQVDERRFIDAAALSAELE